MTLAYIPSPSITAIHIGQITIRMYAIMILIAICTAVAITTTRWKKLGGDFDQILDIAIITVPCGIIGARLYHVITTPERFFGPNGNPADILRIWQGGLGIWGGILLGALAAWAWCHHKHYPTTLLLDAAAPALLIAQGIGRLGNWFNQELYGAPTTLPWGLKLNPDANGAIGTLEMCYDGRTCPADTLFHPTFLYEMLWNFLGAALLIWIGKKTLDTLKSGCLFCLYIMWYTLGRTWIEMLRIDYAHEFLGLRINVWVSLAAFLLALIALMLTQHLGTPTPILSNQLYETTKKEEKERREQEKAATNKEKAKKQAKTNKKHTPQDTTNTPQQQTTPQTPQTPLDKALAQTTKDQQEHTNAFDRLAAQTPTNTTTNKENTNQTQPTTTTPTNTTTPNDTTPDDTPDNNTPDNNTPTLAEGDAPASAGPAAGE